MSKQLAISSSFAIFAMSALALLGPGADHAEGGIAHRNADLPAIVSASAGTDLTLPRPAFR